MRSAATRSAESRSAATRSAKSRSEFAKSMDVLCFAFVLSVKYWPRLTFLPMFAAVRGMFKTMSEESSRLHAKIDAHHAEVFGE